MTTHTAALLLGERFPNLGQCYQAIRATVGAAAMPEVEATVNDCYAAWRVPQSHWAFCLWLRLEAGQPLPVALAALRAQAGPRTVRG